MLGPPIMFRHTQPTAPVSMSALINALYETGMAIVVRYVFRNNSTPKLCALFPHIKPDYEVSNDHMTLPVCVHRVHRYLLHLINTVCIYGESLLLVSPIAKWTSVVSWLCTCICVCGVVCDHLISVVCIPVCSACTCIRSLSWRMSGNICSPPLVRDRKTSPQVTRLLSHPSYSPARCQLNMQVWVSCELLASGSFRSCYLSSPEKELKH